jgi:hypothetical protein
MSSILTNLGNNFNTLFANTSKKINPYVGSDGGCGCSGGDVDKQDGGRKIRKSKKKRAKKSRSPRRKSKRRSRKQHS